MSLWRVCYTKLHVSVTSVLYKVTCLCDECVIQSYMSLWRECYTKLHVLNVNVFNITVSHSYIEPVWRECYTKLHALNVNVFNITVSHSHIEPVSDRCPYVRYSSVAALAMGLRGSSPPRFCSSPPDFCIKWCFVSTSKWQLSLSVQHRRPTFNCEMQK